MGGESELVSQASKDGHKDRSVDEMSSNERKERSYIPPYRRNASELIKELPSSTTSLERSRDSTKIDSSNKTKGYERKDRLYEGGSYREQSTRNYRNKSDYSFEQRVERGG